MSPAVAIATIALIVALGGTSYAAFSLPANSVGTSQLRNRAVASSKLQDGLVTSAKVHGRAITSGKLADGSVTSPKLQNGAVTSTKLAPGAITTSSVPAGAGVNVSYTFGQIKVPAGQQLSAHVTCPGGTRVVGGGLTAGNTAVVINDSAPFNSKLSAWTGGPSDSWGVFVTNTDSANGYDAGIYAVCLVAGTVH